MEQWNILVVEDELDGQEVVCDMLSMNDMHSVAVGDAPTALDYLSANQYDAVIIDIALPEIDGWELLSYIRDNQDLRSIPCLAITAFHNSEVKQKSLESGFDAYLPKPLNSDKLIKELKRLLN